MIFLSALCSGFAPHKQIGRPFLPSSGKINLLVILASFPGQPPKAGVEDAKDMIFSRGKAPTGSVADYFAEVSNGRVEIQGRVIGWFQAGHPETFYAEPAFGHQPESYPHNSGRLVEEAIDFAQKSGVDFADFDNSKSGAVDGLVVLFSGSGGNIGSVPGRLWPRLGYLSMDGSRPLRKNGVEIDRYILVGEQNARGEPNFAAAFCHELGHLFGLPDLYDWNNVSSGIGRFGLMAVGVYGGGKAYWPCAWSRAYLGWSEPEELSSNGKYKLAPAEKNGPVIKISSFEPGEFFLLENREPLGSDSNLFGKGLVIYHVDEKVLTADDQVCPGFCPDAHYLVAVEQADGMNQLEHKANNGDAGDFFPGSAGITSFNDATGKGDDLLLGANSRLWDGELSGIRISRIRLKNGEADFNLKLNQPRNPEPFKAELRLYDYKLADLVDGGSILEPGEQFSITPTLSNQGAKAGRVKLGLFAPGLEPERAEIAMPHAIKPGERVEAGPGFKLKVPAAWQGAKSVELTLSISSRNFQKQEQISLGVGRPDIILVMDDDGLGLGKYYEKALRQTGKVFHTIEIKNGLPDKKLLVKFKLVVWATGVRGADGRPALDEPRQALLAAVMDGGRDLILVSPGIDLAEDSKLASKARDQIGSFQ